jgi:superfamily II DNA/RNA helicase
MPNSNQNPTNSTNFSLQGGLLSSRITDPTDVQRAAIPEILSGSNVAVQCYTGSGKTLAFLLPVMSFAVQRAEQEWSLATRKNRASLGQVQAIVVTPSRELAMQIVRVAESLLPDSAKRAVQQCIGGANMLRQRENLRMYKPIIVVGTPGRLAELSRDGALQTHKCPILVLDEADQLLAPQFREEMQRITEHTGKKCENGRQTIIVSATLTPRVLSLCEVWCPQPRQVFVGAVPGPQSVASSTNDGENDQDNCDQTVNGGAAPTVGAVGADGASTGGPSWGWGIPGSTYIPELNDPGIGSAGGYGNRDAAPAIAPGLTHLYVKSAPQHRVDTLRKAIHATNAQRALVFMNFQQRLKDAEQKLAARKMKVASLHGDMSKQERQNTLAGFKAGKYRALLVSDVAARGLDVPDCDAVFNLELPTDAAHYAHRAGRTGRAGKEGIVVTVASGGETFVVEKLGRRLGVNFAEIKLEGGDAFLVDENLDWFDQSNKDKEAKRQEAEEANEAAAPK